MPFNFRTTLFLTDNGNDPMIWCSLLPPKKPSLTGSPPFNNVNLEKFLKLPLINDIEFYNDNIITIGIFLSHSE